MPRRVLWILFIGLLLAGMRIFPATAFAAAATGKAVAVMPLDSLSRYASHNWMRSAMSEVLAARITGSSQLRILPGEAVAAALRGDSGLIPDTIGIEQAVSVGRTVGADIVIFGKVDKRGNQIVIELSLARTGDGQPIGQASLTGDFEVPWDGLNELSRNVIQKLGSSPTRAQEPRLTQQAARDRYSLTLFGRGVNQLYGIGGPVDLLSAEENLRRALRIDPNNPLFYALYGINQAAQKQDSDANAAYFEALKFWSDYPRVRRSMAQLSEVDNHLEDAISHLQSVVSVEPSDMQAHYDLGRMLIELDRKGAALDEVSLVAQSSAPPSLRVPALKLQAQLRAGLNDINGMGESFKALLTLAPNDAEARIGLASFHMRKGNIAEAETHFKALAAQDPGNPVPVHFLGELALQKGSFDAAVAAFRAEGNIRPSHPSAWSYVGESFRRAKNLPKEIDAEGMVQVRDKKNPIPLNNLAVARLKEGDAHTALSLIKQAIEQAPGWGILYQNQGIILASMRQDVKAIESLQTALLLSPKLSAAQYALGILLAQAGDLKGAAQAFKGACESEPGLAEAFYNLGAVQEALGDRSSAARALNMYVQLAPKAADVDAVKARVAKLK